MNEYPASESNNLLEQISELSRQFRKQIAKGETVEAKVVEKKKKAA